MTKWLLDKDESKTLENKLNACVMTIQSLAVGFPHTTHTGGRIQMGMHLQTRMYNIDAPSCPSAMEGDLIALCKNIKEVYIELSYQFKYYWMQ